MRRFADKLSVIKISFDPPSPPPIIAESECPTPTAAGDIIPYFGDFYTTIENTNLLQVPKIEPDEIERQSSPPPRRCSQTSTFSDSVSISLTSSYQNLLSPSANRGRSASHCFSEESGTPPNEFLFVIQRPLSAQVSFFCHGFEF